MTDSNRETPPRLEEAIIQNIRNIRIFVEIEQPGNNQKKPYFSKMKLRRR